MQGKGRETLRPTPPWRDAAGRSRKSRWPCRAEEPRGSGAACAPRPGQSLTAVPRSATGADGANTQPPAPDGDDGARAPGPPIPASPRLTGFRVKTPCCTHVVGPFTWTAASGTIGRTGTKLVRTPCSPRCSGPRLAAVRPLGTVQTAKSPAEKNQTRRRVKTVALTGRPGGHRVPPPPGTRRRRLGVSPRSALALQRPHTRLEHGVWGYGSFSRVVSEFINLESE